MAALAGGDGILEDLSTEQLRAAAGLPDRTYRRARQALLASGELILLSGVGGRGNTNRWQIQNPRLSAGEPRRPTSGRRAAPPAGARPLVAALAELAADRAPTRDVVADGGVDELNESEWAATVKGGQDRTLSPVNRPVLTEVSGVKGGQDQTLSLRARRKPRQKGRQRPRQLTRARERNPRTPEPNNTPPTPLKGALRELDHDRGDLHDWSRPKTQPAGQRQPRRGPPCARHAGTV